MNRVASVCLLAIAALVTSSQPTLAQVPAVPSMLDVEFDQHVHERVIGTNSCGGPVDNSADFNIRAKVVMRPLTLLRDNAGGWIPETASGTNLSSLGFGTSTFTSVLAASGVVTTTETGSFDVTFPAIQRYFGTVVATETVDLNTRQYTFHRVIDETIQSLMAPCSFVGTRTQDRTGLAPVSFLVDLQISSVRMAQVVFGKGKDPNANGDLVLGKRTVARATIQRSGDLSANTPVVIRLMVSGLNVADEVRTVAELETDPVVSFYFTPSQEGRLDLIAEVNPIGVNGSRGIEESDQSNNVWPKQGTSNVAVKRTAPLSVAFIKLDCDGPIDNANLQRFTDDSFKFATAVFPVDPATAVHSVDYQSGLMEPGLCLPPPVVMPSETPAVYQKRVAAYQLQLLNQLWSSGRRTPGMKRIIAVTSPSWMSRLDPRHAEGLTFCNHPAAIVVEGSWEATAHELGHTYGLTDFRSTDLCKEQIPAGEESEGGGFWVNEEREIFAPSLMSGSPIIGRYPDGNQTWPWRDDYEALFKQFAANPADPELLLISGLIDTNDRVTINPVYWVPAGIPDTTDPGETSVRLLDATGAALSEHSFTLTFLKLDPPTPTEVAGFAFAVPYVLGASSIEITRHGTAVMTFGIAGRLLSDAVRSVPNGGFFVSAQKAALLNKVMAFEKLVALGDTIGAREKLEYDIRLQVQSWLRDGYAVSSRLGYTKTQLVELIDAILPRLQ